MVGLFMCGALSFLILTAKFRAVRLCGTRFISHGTSLVAGIILLTRINDSFCISFLVSTAVESTTMPTPLVSEDAGKAALEHEESERDYTFVSLL